MLRGPCREYLQLTATCDPVQVPPQPRHELTAQLATLQFQTPPTAVSLRSPTSQELLVDPVRCSDGRTHCRWSAFRLMDSRHAPGCDGTTAPAAITAAVAAASASAATTRTCAGACSPRTRLVRRNGGGGARTTSVASASASSGETSRRHKYPSEYTLPYWQAFHHLLDPNP